MAILCRHSFEPPLAASFPGYYVQQVLEIKATSGLFAKPGIPFLPFMTIQDATSNIPSKCGSSALSMAPRKKASSSDPLVFHGRHFGQTVFALCNYPSLLTNGILRLEQMEDTPLEDFPAE
ncbi:uncharacterized protein F5147DRAFT_776210 [Suillus discolor]|uniref:Uncharacterized protein n=1 Tax=Suillus discolor TaxID=1912936 RepID=A0A9P7F2N3_9AGAM|nr:uncharacterized protein F5147DRAFT_776210 [Suillus discolor]KAG2102861.1 hypothetical protein F5147DRAFT_776210 [Suillus discolor]